MEYGFKWHNSFYAKDLGRQAERWIVKFISYFICYKPEGKKKNKKINILIMVGPFCTNVILDYIQAKEGNIVPHPSIHGISAVKGPFFKNFELYQTFLLKLQPQFEKSPVCIQMGTLNARHSLSALVTLQYPKNTVKSLNFVIHNLPKKHIRQGLSMVCMKRGI